MHAAQDAFIGVIQRTIQARTAQLVAVQRQSIMAAAAAATAGSLQYASNAAEHEEEPMLPEAAEELVDRQLDEGWVERVGAESRAGAQRCMGSVTAELMKQLLLVLVEVRRPVQWCFVMSLKVFPTAFCCN
jgi:hypothetical protein